jgi:twitching motility protein PilI
MSTTSSLSRLQELLPELFRSTQLTGDPYLRFGLTSELSALLSMEYVKESLLVAGENITPLPNMSGAVMGLMNSRDRVFCVIDLAQLLGLSPLSTYSRQYHTIVARIFQAEKELLLGIAVNRVQGISRVISEEMRSPPRDFPPSLIPYLHGCLKDQEKHLPVLNIEAIVKQTLST